MADIVECHSGSAYAERPTALAWQGQRLIIAEILSQGRIPQARWFRVRTVENLFFELTLGESAGERPSEHEWQIHQL